MARPHGIQLAVHLISSFYGDLCSKVCECLLRRGTLTLANIIRFTELTRGNVVTCLRVLIHQNCVQAFYMEREGSANEPSKNFTQYMALFDSIIHKLRTPKFMQIVSEKLGKDCVGIFLGLVQHGRLSFKQITERNEGSCDLEVVRESFNKLLRARFIERCPAPEPLLEPIPEDEKRANKRAAKSAKFTGGPQSIEQRVLEIAAPLDSMRFSMEMDGVTEKNDEEISKSAMVGKKRKKGVLLSDEGVLDHEQKKDVLWRVNFDELVRQLRMKACISYVKAKINNEAGIVLGAIWELNGQSDSRQKTEQTAYLSINDIYDEVIKTDTGLGMDIERIQLSLEQLGCQTLSAGLEEKFSVDIKGIIEMARTEEVESVVLKRYGREAYRMFRLLSKTEKFVETDKIADSTFVDKKVTTQILYKLWKDEYLGMETVTTTGSGRQMQFLCWKVCKPQLWDQVLDEMYHAALNLRLRKAQLQEEAKEVAHLPRDKLVGALKDKFERLGRVRMILDTSLIDVDDVIMLFHDF